MHKVVLLSLLSLLVAACGGGSSGPEPEEPPPFLPGKLAFVESLNSIDRLFVSDGDGSNRREVAIASIDVLSAHDAGELNLRVNQISALGPPAWSPDGSRIAIPVFRSPTYSQILIVDAVSGMATTASYQLGRAEEPDWAPDEGNIAYVYSHEAQGSLRLTITDLTTGNVTEPNATSDTVVSAHRFTADSGGIYIAHPLPDGFNETLLLNLQTGALGSYASATGSPVQDIARLGGRLVGDYDNEHASLLVVEPYRSPPISSIYGSAPGLGPLSGWYLATDDLIAVEQIAGNQHRAPPQIIKRTPVSGSTRDAFTAYSVSAPVAFKWDFYATAN